VAAWTKTFTASRARSSITPRRGLSTSPSPSTASPTSTLIWWERYNLVIIVIIFSQSLIVHPNGWKLFPLPPLPQLTVHTLLSFIRLPSLEYPPQSLLIVGLNLFQV
jgi:hypothetical protein